MLFISDHDNSFPNLFVFPRGMDIVIYKDLKIVFRHKIEEINGLIKCSIV